MYAHDEFEPDHSTSPTGHAIEALELYGFRPAVGEADPRITPKDTAIQGAVADIFDALISTMADTSLDFDLDEIMWSTVNTFHRAVERIERKLDDNEQAQKRLQREQDGSEVISVQLETLIGIGQSLIERRDSMETFRDTAADLYLRSTGTPWSPRSGSRVNHRQMTSAMIDSRDFIAAKRRADNEVLLPAGPKIAFSGGTPPITARSGPGSIRCMPSTPTWCSCTEAVRKAPSASRPLGPTTARCRRSPLSPTGRNTPRPRPSSATTGCSIPCRSGSSSSPERVSRKTSPTRPARWVSRSTASRRAARERCTYSKGALPVGVSPTVSRRPKPEQSELKNADTTGRRSVR